MDTALVIKTTELLKEQTLVELLLYYDITDAPIEVEGVKVNATPAIGLPEVVTRHHLLTEAEQHKLQYGEAVFTVTSVKVPTKHVKPLFTEDLHDAVRDLWETTRGVLLERLREEFKYVGKRVTTRPPGTELVHPKMRDRIAAVEARRLHQKEFSKEQKKRREAKNLEAQGN
jgi:hypothetical protein